MLGFLFLFRDLITVILAVIWTSSQSAIHLSKADIPCLVLFPFCLDCISLYYLFKCITRFFFITIYQNNPYIRFQLLVYI